MIEPSRRVTLIGAAAGLALATLAGPAAAGPAPNTQAPVFTAEDTRGETVDLAALEGRPVVLEWTNHGCPFVRKHYGAGNMQALQKEAAAQGAVWITVISSAPGTQGHVTPAKADALTESRGAAPAHVVLDPAGTIGRMYDARTTPHMVVITPAGDIAFIGGIDDRPSTRESDIPGATNYVRAALEAVKAGETPAVQTARPYGCSIKYAS